MYAKSIGALKKFEQRLLRVGTRSEQTRETYRTAVGQFAEVLDMSPSEIVAAVENGKDPYTLIDTFVGDLLYRDKSPQTVRVYVAGVRKFFEANDIFIYPRELNARVEMPKPKTRSHDRIPTEEELKLVFNVLDLRGRALMAVLVSSGMRIGAARKITLRDVHFDEEITWVNLRASYTKGKNPRIVFISDEATAVLRQYIESEKRRGRFQSQDERVFPISKSTSWYILNNAFKKANLIGEKEYGRYDLHPHSLRKYYRTMLAAAGVPESFISKLMGHRKYLDESYLRAKKEMLVQEYRKAMPKLTISTPVKKETKFDKLLQMAESLGISESELREFVTERFFHGQVYVPAEGEELPEGGGIDVLELAYAIFPEEVDRLFKELVQRKLQGTDNPGNAQKVVEEEQLEDYLAKGYKVENVLPSGRIVVAA
ncbi:MAG: tyrosine-type recombinase/integrase [Thermoplasmatota archaeon]